MCPSATPHVHPHEWVELSWTRAQAKWLQDTHHLAIRSPVFSCRLSSYREEESREESSVDQHKSYRLGGLERCRRWRAASYNAQRSQKLPRSRMEPRARHSSPW